MVRGKALKWLCGLGVTGAFLCLKGCMLSFDDYPAADLCAASNDAGIDPSTAPDPALRGCEAGPPAPVNEDSGQGTMGASGMAGEK
ncbi:MAG: hypothetical protein WDO69_01390 [Pseudomonadota bacterium]